MGVEDDIYRPCFQCEDITSRSGVPDYAYTYIDRQSGEAFQVTQPSRRVICRGPVAGRGRRCKLRISRAMQFRQTRYGSVLRFVQAERYLTCPLMILILLDITNSLDIFYCDYATDYMFIYSHCQLPVITFTQKYTQLPKYCIDADLIK